MNSRRKFIRNSALSTGAALVSTNSIAAVSQKNTSEGKLKILVAGAHPDDPETGMGGTISKYTSQGHEVVCLYLTTGEAGIPGTNHEQAAVIRNRSHSPRVIPSSGSKKSLFSGAGDEREMGI